MAGSLAHAVRMPPKLWKKEQAIPSHDLRYTTFMRNPEAEFLGCLLRMQTLRVRSVRLLKSVNKELPVLTEPVLFAPSLHSIFCYAPPPFPSCPRSAACSGSELRGLHPPPRGASLSGHMADHDQ